MSHNEKDDKIFFPILSTFGHNIIFLQHFLLFLIVSIILNLSSILSALYNIQCIQCRIQRKQILQPPQVVIITFLILPRADNINCLCWQKPCRPQKWPFWGDRYFLLPFFCCYFGHSLGHFWPFSQNKTLLPRFALIWDDSTNFLVEIEPHPTIGRFFSLLNHLLVIRL